MYDLQFALPHTRGSSHGQTRIIRKAYEASHYVRMMPAAYRQWEELEKAEHTEIMRSVFSMPTVKVAIYLTRCDDNCMNPERDFWLLVNMAMYGT